MLDSARFGGCRLGYFRLGVINPSYERLSITHTDGGFGVEVTHRRMTYGESRNTTTNWLERSYTESTVTGVFMLQGATPSLIIPGSYVLYDASFSTLDGVYEYDQLLYEGEYYRVHSVQPFYDAEGSFAYRACQLVKLSLYR